MNGTEAARVGLVNHCVEQNQEGNAAYVKALGKENSWYFDLIKK